MVLASLNHLSLYLYVSNRETVTCNNSHIRFSSYHDNTQEALGLFSTRCSAFDEVQLKMLIFSILRLLTRVVFQVLLAQFQVVVSLLGGRFYIMHVNEEVSFYWCWAFDGGVVPCSLNSHFLSVHFYLFRMEKFYNCFHILATKSWINFIAFLISCVTNYESCLV